MNKELKMIKVFINQNQKLKKRIKKLEESIEKMNTFKEVLTTKEIELEYNISQKTLDRYRKSGLKVMQPVRNGKKLVKRIEIEKFLNNKKPW